MSSKFFSKMEIDAIGEILNISLGASATAVSTMLNARVDITTPIVNVVEKDEFKMDKMCIRDRCRGLMKAFPRRNRCR